MAKTIVDTILKDCADRLTDIYVKENDEPMDGDVTEDLGKRLIQFLDVINGNEGNKTREIAIKCHLYTKTELPVTGKEIMLPISNYEDGYQTAGYKTTVDKLLSQIENALQPLGISAQFHEFRIEEN